jgi:hypothetical protein
MPRGGYLTSSTLLDTIKREAFIPVNQSTLTDDDLLDMANQEVRIGMMPSIMQYHQEYLVRSDTPTPIVVNQASYAIPYRAVGGKVRELFYLDNSNNLCLMSRISPDHKPYYQQSAIQNNYLHYFLEGDSVLLMPFVNSSPVGSLVFSYYMKPNELVDESRVATILTIANTNTSGAITAITAAASAVITSPNHGLTSGNIILISGSNCTPVVDGFQTVSVLDANRFTVPITTTSPGTQGSWTYQTTTYGVDQLPSNVTPFLQGGTTVSGFTPSTLLDICQTLPGHKTMAYDISPLAVNSINKTITFYTPDIVQYIYSPNVNAAPVPGDYIAFAGEAIIPQIPSDLHDVLSQRVVLRALQALGDTQGYQIAASKLAEMEKSTATLIDNRTEGSPQKVSNLGGTLRAVKAFNKTRYY